MRKYFLRIVLALVSAVVLIFIITGFKIVHMGINDNIERSDVGIILGSKVNPDGTLSSRLKARLDIGILLYRAGIIKNIIVSGGTGKEGVNEAFAMKNYLIANQIPSNLIIEDSNGNTTAATAKNSAKIMRSHNFKSALIISQYFHIMRTKLALQQCGIDKLHWAHAKYFELRDTYSLGREVVGFYYYFIHNKC